MMIYCITKIEQYHALDSQGRAIRSLAYRLPDNNFGLRYRSSTDDIYDFPSENEDRFILLAVNQRKLHMKWHPENEEHGASH